MNRETAILKKIEQIAEKTEMDAKDIGLFNGKAGIIMWYFYLSRYVNDSYYEIAESSLLKILNTLQYPSLLSSHCGGYSGICWMLMHLKEYDFIDMDTDILDNTDEHLFNAMVNGLNHDDWDFLHGASGIVLYFLKKRQNSPENKSIDKYIDYFINRMCDIAIYDKDGSMKWTSNLFSSDMTTMRKGYNICLSHGTSSLLVIFVKIFLLYNKSNDSLYQMIKKTAQYIINQRIDEKIYKSCFPSCSIESDQPLLGSRMAWCYGDLGIAIALWQAGVALNEQEWCKIAVETMQYATLRKIDPTVKEAGICHGTAGIAHIFNRMFHYTNMEQFKSSSDYWINESLKMAKFEDGIAGYKTYFPKDPGTFINDYDLLTGVSGIGLCLLSEIYNDASAWDECFLLS